MFASSRGAHLDAWAKLNLYRGLLLGDGVDKGFDGPCLACARCCAWCIHHVFCQRLCSFLQGAGAQPLCNGQNSCT